MSDQITTVEEMGALPVGSVWLTACGLLGETIRPINRGLDIACVRIEGVEHLALTIGGSDFPITVLYRPDAPEPIYDPITHTWSHECPCIRAEQRDPECLWHGRHDSPTSVTLEADTHTEWGVRFEHNKMFSTTFDDAETARRYAVRGEGVVVRREVTDWRNVDGVTVADTHTEGGAR